MLSGGYLLVAAKVAISIFVNQLNATNLKSSKTQFQFQFELSLAQLSPSLFSYQLDCSPSLPTEPNLRLEAAKSTTGKLNVVVVHVVPHTISFVTSRDVARRPTT